MAAEMTSFTRNQIMMQAGTAMLAPGERGSANRTPVASSRYPFPPTGGGRGLTAPAEADYWTTRKEGTERVGVIA